MNIIIFWCYIFCIGCLWIFKHTVIGIFFATYYLLLRKLGVRLTLIFFFIRIKIIELFCNFYFYFLLSYTLLMPYRLLYKWYSYSLIIIIIGAFVLYLYLKNKLNKIFTDPNYPYNFYCWFDVLFFSIIIKPTAFKVRIRSFLLIVQPVLLRSFFIRIHFVKSKPFFILIIQHFFYLLHFCVYIPCCLYTIGVICHG
jgi:hypothetical protein